MCSTSHQECEIHQQFVKSIKPFSKTNYDEMSHKLFIIFQRNVKKCPKRKNWRSTDICLNSKILNGDHIQNKLKIQCPSTHSFHCEKNVCSVNSFACNGFKLKYKYNAKAKLFGFKDCEIENI